MNKKLVIIYIISVCILFGNFEVNGFIQKNDDSNHSLSILVIERWAVLVLATSWWDPGKCRLAMLPLHHRDSTARPARRWPWVSARRSPRQMHRRRAAWRSPNQSQILRLHR